MHAALVLLIMTLTAGGQDAIVRGHVVDAATGKPLAGAVVHSGEHRVVTDEAGRFTVTVAGHVAILVVSASGYLTESSRLDIAGRHTDVEIRLAARPQVLEQVNVTADRAPVFAPREVTPIQARSTPGAGENIFRTLQVMPGVAAADEFGSRVSVRGGGPDQNLTVMDGVEIYNPYRLFGLTSAFNPETIERFEFTAGGFSARYGDRLSSLLVVENRAGKKQSAPGGSAGLSLTDGNLVAEGMLPGTSRGSWLVSGRRTYYDLIAGPIIDTDLPSFADLQAHVVWEPRAGQRLAVFGLASRETADARLEGDAAGERVGLQSTSRNDLAAVSFASSIGARGSSRTILSWTRNREAFDVAADFRNASRRSNRPEENAAPFANLAFARTLAVRDLAIRQELTVTAGAAHVLESGFETHGIRTQWAWRIAGDRNPHEANATTMFGGSGLPALLDAAAAARRTGAWLIDRWTVAPWLRAESGVRVDWSGVAGEVIASPRLAVAADVRWGVRLRAAGGLFTQSPGYEKLLQADYFVDLRDARSLGLRSQRAWHGVVGAERPLPGGWLARAEGYVKQFERMIVGRLETPAETAARAAAYDFPAALASSVPRTPRITSVPSSAAAGRAYGIDLYLAGATRRAGDRVSGWIAYTLGRAETQAYGRRAPFDYDRRHALSVVGAYRVRASLDVGATLRVQSGFPYTPAVGVRAAAVADMSDLDGDGNTAELVPQRDATGLLVWEADMGDTGTLNAARLPVFVRIDARATYRPGGGRSRWQVYLDVINVLNRQNAGSMEPVLNYDPASDRPRLAAVRQRGVPLLPSVGIRYRF